MSDGEGPSAEPSTTDLMLDAHTLGLEKERFYPGTARELLNGAADSIERFGHNKGVMGNTTYGFCAHGALDHVIWTVGHGERFSADVIREASGRIVRAIGTNRIVEWNDSPERTKEQVVLALRQAAQWESPQEERSDEPSEQA